MLQNEPNDIPNDYTSGDIPLNTQPNTLYIDKPDEKPFITSIHDRNLYTGEEYSYNVNMVNSMDDIPINRDNNIYSGIDLINDTLSGNHNVDIYDEVLKRKENELFGINHKKHTTINRFAKPA
ncbi:acidic terminal segment protein, partial [Plasmodium falciparum NF54]